MTNVFKNKNISMKFPPKTFCSNISIVENVPEKHGALFGPVWPCLAPQWKQGY